MESFVARQPILTRGKKLFGYELLFRGGMNNLFPNVDGNVATSNLLSSSFLSIGIDNISGGKRAFVNFTEQLLLKETPSLFPSETLVVEVLENVEPTPQMIEACTNLKNKGYTIALDDFVYAEKYQKLVDLADIIKVDFMNSTDEEIQKIVETVQRTPCRLLAEKIESYEEFEQAKQMGFSFFQGYFFSKPEVLRNKEIPLGKLTTLQLIAEINKTDLDIEVMEKIINQDVAMSYKLLQYLNSAYYSRLSPLKSIRQAIAFLGEKGARLFVTLVATAQLADGKPDELAKLSIIRSRFLENIGKEIHQDSNELFMLGLFSLISAMLDKPMDQLANQLPLSDTIIDALVNNSGPYAIFLKLLESHEKGDWEEFQTALDYLSLNPEKISEFYLDAIAMAENF